MSHFVYILYSEKLDKYYVGSSHDPEMRLHYHNLCRKGWTKPGIPWKLVFKKEYEDKKTAMERERYIKRQKDRKYIERLISNEVVF